MKICAVPILISESKAQAVAEKRISGSRFLSADLQYIPYWISCYTFKIPRLFMKPRSLEIWIACNAAKGGAFPIRIDGDLFEEKDIPESSILFNPVLEKEEALETCRTAAYEAFVKRYLAMQDPKVELSFNDLVYFPMWHIVMENKDNSETEVLLNSRTGGIENSRRIGR